MSTRIISSKSFAWPLQHHTMYSFLTLTFTVVIDVCVTVLNVLKTTFAAEDNSYRDLRCEIMRLKLFIVKSDPS